MNSNCIPSTMCNNVKDSKKDDFESLIPNLLIIKKLNFKRKISFIEKGTRQDLDPRLLHQLLEVIFKSSLGTQE